MFCVMFHICVSCFYKRLDEHPPSEVMSGLVASRQAFIKCGTLVFPVRERRITHFGLDSSNLSYEQKKINKTKLIHCRDKITHNTTNEKTFQ